MGLLKVMFLTVKYGCYIVMFLVLSGAFSETIFANGSEEHKVETAFIYQFTNYIDWPEGADGLGSDVFVITVVGDSPIFYELEKLAKSKKVKNRPIQVFKILETSQLKKSEIIYIASQESATLSRVSEKARGSSALIISHNTGFAKKGAMINFYNEGGRLRFELNQMALKSEKLKVSSQLLKLAKLIE